MDRRVRHLSLERIGLHRLGEAEREAELARDFLEDGLVRNAAGKAFQAWKSLLSFYAISNRDLLEARYRGFKSVGAFAVPLSEWVAAVMPTSRMSATQPKSLRRHGADRSRADAPRVPVQQPR